MCGGGCSGGGGSHHGHHSSGHHGGGHGGGGCNMGCNVSRMTCDPCFQKLCCNTRRPFSFKPFCPSYERCGEDVKMGKLLGYDYQRRWFCERNVWLCENYGQCGGGCCV